MTYEPTMEIGQGSQAFSQKWQFKKCNYPKEITVTTKTTQLQILRGIFTNLSQTPPKSAFAE